MLCRFDRVGLLWFDNLCLDRWLRLMLLGNLLQEELSAYVEILLRALINDVTQSGEWLLVFH